MGFSAIVVGALSRPEDFNQIIDAWTGAAAANPLVVAVDSARYALDVQNQDTTNQKTAVLKYGSAEVLRITGSALLVNQPIAPASGMQVGGLLVGSHDHSCGTKGLKIPHANLSNLTVDDHTQYYNAARHTKALHDALGIDAGTLGGKGPQAFPPWADFNRSQTAYADSAYTLPKTVDTWSNIPGATLTITITAISDFFTSLQANIPALSGDFTTTLRFRLAVTKSGSTTYTETLEERGKQEAMAIRGQWVLRGLEPGTYTLQVQVSRNAASAYDRPMGARRLSALVLPATPVVEETGDWAITVPSQSFKMGDAINVNVVYKPNAAVWLMVNNEWHTVVRGKTNASGVATLTIQANSPNFVEGYGTPNVPALFVLSVWGEGTPTKVAHTYIAIGAGDRCEFVNVVATPTSVTGKLRKVGTTSYVSGATVYVWGDSGEVSGNTDGNGQFTIACDNPRYVVFKGHKLNDALWAGCVHTIKAPFAAVFTRITPRPISFAYDANMEFDAGHHYHVPWSEVHTNAPGASNEFNWQAIDKHLEAAAARGKQFVLGISIYKADGGSTPNHRVMTPSWLPQSDRYILMTSGGAQAYLFPYDSTNTKAKYQRFIEQLAARYDGDSRLAAVIIAAGIDDEAVRCKNATAEWSSIAANYVSDAQWNAWLKWIYDLYVANFHNKPLIWGGFRPPSRGVYRFAKDGVIYKTNMFTEKGEQLSYGGSGKQGCTTLLEGYVPCGCEPKGGAFFNGSRTDENKNFVESDLSGHLYTIATMMLKGNRFCDFFPEYLDGSGPFLKTSQVMWRRFIERAWAKDTWWVILREVPASSDGIACPTPAGGACMQRGPLAWRVTYSGGSLIPRTEWLNSGIPVWYYAGITRYDWTAIDCLPFDSHKHGYWVDAYCQNGRKGTITLYFLGASDGTYNADLCFFGTGGFTVGGVSVPSQAKAKREVMLTGVQVTSGQLTIDLGDNYLTFFHLWR